MEWQEKREADAGIQDDPGSGETHTHAHTRTLTHVLQVEGEGDAPEHDGGLRYRQ